MSLQGLPDFQQPIREGVLQIFHPYEGRGNFALAPDRLVIAERDDGRPDFKLELVRGKTVYGMLDFRLQPGFRVEEALTLLRARYPEARLARAVFASGYLRIRPALDVDDLPKELFNPIPLAWNGLGVGRFILKVARDTAAMLKTALLDQKMVALDAVAEVEMIGVSPRLPARARFDPAKLLAALVALGDSERRVARASVVNFFRRDSESSLIEITADLEGEARDEFAEAMADRVRVRFGTFTPSPVEPVAPYFALPEPGTIGSGKFEWDLSEPMLAPRPSVLILHPLETARELVEAEGISAVYHETTASAAPTGFFTVSVFGILPAERPNTQTLGVTIRVPPDRRNGSKQ